MSSSQYRLSVLTNSISRMNGGIFDSMRNLTLAIAAESRYLPVVFSARDAYTKIDEPLWGEHRDPDISGSWPAHLRLRIGARIGGREQVMRTFCISTASGCIRRLWPGVGRGRRRPYVVSPHGLLKPRALRNSRWKKRIAGLLYENEHLRHAACLHALNAAEAESFREYGLKNPICVIPNGTTLRNDIARTQPPQGRSLLYLGRIHPSKGLRSLIEAWSAVRDDAAAAGWRLTIAGWDQNHHRAELERLAEQLEVRSSIDFLGPQFDADKDRCLAAASAFILPSESEGQPISILEAWSWGLPVLMTRECNLPDGAKAGAAILMDPDARSIAAAMRQLFSMTDREREAMGRNGRCLVEERYQWQRIGKAMTEVYDWILGRGPKPDCVLA